MQELSCKANAIELARIAESQPIMSKKSTRYVDAFVVRNSSTNCSPSNTLSLLVREVSFIYALVCSPTLFYINLQQY